jgi:diguanylate cyclase (GGDEF)-like protein
MASWMNHKWWSAAPAVTGGRLMARSFGAIYAAGATITFISLLLSPPAGAPMWPAVVSCLFAYGVAGLTFHPRAARLGRGTFDLAVATGTVLITVAFIASSADPKDPTAILYLWAVPFGFWYSPLWRALGQLALVAACYGVDLSASPSSGLESRGDLASRWVMLVGTLAMLGVLLRVLAGELGREQERRENELRLRRRQADSEAVEQASLRRVATAVAAEIDLQSLFDLAAREAAALFSIEHAAIVRFESETLVRIVGVWTDGDAGGFTRGRALGVVPGGPVDQIRTERAPVRSLLSTPDTPFPYRIAAPIGMTGELWGMIVVGTSEADSFARVSEERLERFAGLVALAIANAEGREQLAALAFGDSLTGLANHRHFQDRLTEEIDRARAAGKPLSLVLLDVDQLKEVNDGYGHGVGDDLLRTVAARMKAAARDDGLLARIGGDEFALLLPGADGETALERAEELRAAVSSEPFGDIGTITLSAGACDLEPAGSRSDLLRLADSALYWAKGHGRDRAVLSSAGEDQDMSADDHVARVGRHKTLSALRALARAIDAKDPVTRQHHERVASLTVTLAGLRGWSSEDQARLRSAALIHDVGRLGDAEVLEEGALCPLDAHTTLGARMASEVLDAGQTSWILRHHERFDAGLRCEGAALLALAEAWDELTTAHADTPALPLAEALAECRADAGTRFDPAAVAALELVIEPRLGARLAA